MHQLCICMKTDELVKISSHFKLTARIQQNWIFRLITKKIEYDIWIWYFWILVSCYSSILTCSGSSSASSSPWRSLTSVSKVFTSISLINKATTIKGKSSKCFTCRYWTWPQVRYNTYWVSVKGGSRLRHNAITPKKYNDNRRTICRCVFSVSIAT